MYRSFLDMEPPKGYVPGVGRGAVGFSTRQDTGTATNRADGLPEDDNDRYRDADEGGLLSYRKDEDDDEADRIFASVEGRMSERRKLQREERERKEKEEREKSKSELSGQFAQEKRDLSQLSFDDWAAIPAPQDITRKNKRRRLEDQANRRTYAVSDSIAAQRHAQGQLQNSVDPQEEDTSEATDFKALSQAKVDLLNVKLGSTSTDNSVDQAKLLDQLTKQEQSYLADPGVSQQSEEMFKAMIKSDDSGDGYVAYAQALEKQNKLAKARLIIAEGCGKFKKNPDAWVSNIKLNDRHNAKIIAKDAVIHNPSSAKLWHMAYELEDTEKHQRHTIERALEELPEEASLWEKYVQLQTTDKDKREVLKTAVEMVPSSEPMWMQLARLESPKQAKKVLGQARQHLRTSRAVWIEAAKCDEKLKGTAEPVNGVIERGVKELTNEKAQPSREQWVQDAYACENEGYKLVCHAIIKATIGQDVSEDERIDTWLYDAESAVSQSKFETARAIYAHALREFPSSKPFWMALAKLEREHGTSESAIDTLTKALDALPTDPHFWLALIHEHEKTNVDEARKTLAKAFELLPGNDEIWLSAVRLEVSQNQTDKARKVLKLARDKASSEKIWVRSVLFERRCANNDAALSIAEEGLQKYPKGAKLYMQKGQIYELNGDIPNAAATYSAGTKSCPGSVPLWLLLANVELSRGMAIKARSVLDKATLLHKTDEHVWLARVRLEKSVHNIDQASRLLEAGLQNCPKKGALLSEQLLLVTKLIERRKMMGNAVVTAKQSADGRADPAREEALVVCTAARTFWSLGKTDQADKYFAGIVEKDPDYGDFWLWYYKFLTAHGRHQEAQTVLDKFVQVRPSQGEVWVSVAKRAENYGKPLAGLFNQALEQL